MDCFGAAAVLRPAISRRPNKQGSFRSPQNPVSALRVREVTAPSDPPFAVRRPVVSPLYLFDAIREGRVPRACAFATHDTPWGGRRGVQPPVRRFQLAHIQSIPLCHFPFYYSPPLYYFPFSILHGAPTLRRVRLDNRPPIKCYFTIGIRSALS